VIALGVIPARFGSTRFPGKPLVLINGKALLTWVIEAALRSRKLTQIIVATDDERIAELARKSGVEVAMTDSDLPTGTDRIWQAVRGRNADVVLNIQGDEPLLQPAVLDALLAHFEADPLLEMATAGRALTYEALLSPQTAKIVLNQRGEAIYFSRFPIPYSRVDAERDEVLGASLKHIGIYAYRKDFLQRFCAQAPVDAEIREGLEQLRALYLGARIKVVQVESESWGVDVPDDVQKIEKILAGKEI
jgi:3-deoxy-manno-octulosonate cytidylyltransferase (CMP-KDO synthetase)